MTPWQLPTRAVIGGKVYDLHADYRDILEIFSYLDNPDMPEYLRWQVALALFYEGEISEEDTQEAITYLVTFLNGGRREEQRPAPRLLDWEQDAAMIVADVNKVAGQEIRAMDFLHWWSFLAWFHAIGEGQLSTVVAIREKLQRGKPLETWEKEFYRGNKEKVDLPKRYSAQDLQEQDRLKELLGEK